MKLVIAIWSYSLLLDVMVIYSVHSSKMLKNIFNEFLF